MISYLNNADSVYHNVSVFMVDELKEPPIDYYPGGIIWVKPARIALWFWL